MDASGLSSRSVAVLRSMILESRYSRCRVSISPLEAFARFAERRSSPEVIVCPSNVFNPPRSRALAMLSKLSHLLSIGFTSLFV